MKKNTDFIEENGKLSDFINAKYGSFNVNTLIEFFKNDFYNGRVKLTEESIKNILMEIDKLLEFQGLNYNDLVFLGSGQSFGVIQVGDAVVKIGKEVDYGDEFYRLPPVHERNLGNGAFLYVSQRANGRSVTEDEMLTFYQKIKDSGSIWIDPKENNLGFVDHFVDFKKLYGVDFGSGYEGPYLIDYEDVITVNDDNKRDLLSWYGTKDDNKYLLDENDKWTFYYKLFVRKRNNLLDVEKKIAMKKGDFDYAYDLEIQEQKNNEGKMDFYDPNYYTGDKSNYPKSKEIQKRERKYKVVSAIKKFGKKDDTKKHR